MADQDKKPVTIDTVEYSSCTPFVVNITTGRVVKVYDGDTITVATNVINDNVSDTFYRFSVRIRGIDCPEIGLRMLVKKSVLRLLEKLSWIPFITRLLH